MKYYYKCINVKKNIFVSLLINIWHHRSFTYKAVGLSRTHFYFHVVIFTNKWLWRDSILSFWGHLHIPKWQICLMWLWTPKWHDLRFICVKKTFFFAFPGFGREMKYISKNNFTLFDFWLQKSGKSVFHGYGPTFYNLK